MNGFYSKLADIFEVDDVKPDSVLRDYDNWDSLTVISIMAMDLTYGVSISADDLLTITTVGELADTIAAKRAK